MESIGTASRTVIVGHCSQTVLLPEKDLDKIWLLVKYLKSSLEEMNLTVIYRF